MVDVDRLVELLPHYLALLIVLFLVIGVIRATIGDLGLWVELLILLAISFAYPPIVRRLGIAPSAWERSSQ